MISSVKVRPILFYAHPVYPGNTARNGGQTLISKNGKPSGSVTGQKMYQFDSNENNWDFSLLAVGSKFLSCFIEEDLQAKYRPVFNADHMGGK